MNLGCFLAVINKIERVEPFINSNQLSHHPTNVPIDARCVYSPIAIKLCCGDKSKVLVMILETPQNDFNSPYFFQSL